MSNKAEAGWKLVFILLFFISLITAAAEAPLAVATPKKARALVVNSARSYLGVPYIYGGTTSDGLDCSGLVWRTYIDSFGRAPLGAMPRTARDLFSFAESIPKDKLQPGDLVFFNTTGPFAHVGIYAGEGRFIHAASDGNPTGVIESSLSERYWSAHYAGAGRIVPPAEYLGILLTASLGPGIGADSILRSVDASALLSYRLGGLEAGLELRPSWDRGLGVVRLPLVLSLAIDRHLRFFAGPTLTLGTPNLDFNGSMQAYAASGGYISTIGVVWSPLTFRVAGKDAALYADLVYDRYERADSSAASAVDLVADLRAGIGISMRWGF